MKSPGTPHFDFQALAADAGFINALGQIDHLSRCESGEAPE